MRWLALRFETTHEASELIEDFLSCLGASGVQTEDAVDIKNILSNPSSLSYADDEFLENLDDKVRILAFFKEFVEGVRCRPDAGFEPSGLYDETSVVYLPISGLEDLIRERLDGFSENLPIGQGYLGWQEVREEDWAENWKQHYHTFRLTDRLVINPSWINYQPADGEIVITLDPGCAFGTGTHETTAMCAELLDELLLPGDYVLDLGTGSGILAIIAAKLEAGSVEAIDIDPMSIGAARANLAINQVEAECRQSELSGARKAWYDIIVANITADVICGLAGDISGRLAGDGLFIASGIISDKLDRVLDAAKAAGMEFVVCREKGDWRTAVFRKSL